MSRSDYQLLGAVAVAMLVAFVVNACFAVSVVPRAHADEVATLHDAINRYRVSQGLRPFLVDTKLVNASDAHNRWMRDNNCFAHQCPGEADPWQRMRDAGYPSPASEVIGRGYIDPATALKAWLDSAPHRSILLDGTYNRIGCAVDFYTTEPEGWLYTCVLAYTPHTPTPAPLPTETPMTLPPRTPVPLASRTPTPSPPAPTPDPRGRLPAGYLMRVWLPDGSNTASDCRMAGTSCFRVIQADYDLLNLAPFNPWLVTDYLFYAYCGLNGVMCEWIRK